jgi:hypothetical protein
MLRHHFALFIIGLIGARALVKVREESHSQNIKKCWCGGAEMGVLFAAAAERRHSRERERKRQKYRPHFGGLKFRLKRPQKSKRSQQNRKKAKAK